MNTPILHCSPRRRRLWTITITSVMLGAILAGCTTPGSLGRPSSPQKLPGWELDNHAEAWPALLRSCEAVKRIKNEAFTAVCEKAKSVTAPDQQTAKAFFETHFVARPVKGKDRNRGLITGYYAPLLKGSRTPDDTYRWPVYAPPKDLLRIELGELFPELKGKRVRGRVVGNRVVPYLSRDEIDTVDAAQPPLKGNELLWVDNAADVFFLQIQGSGRVQLTDGSLVGVGYADQNGHPYVPIGRELIRMNEINREDVSLQSIRAWLDANPDRAMDLYAKNPSYVFFALNENGSLEPKGSLAVRLTPERSLAVDRTKLPFGLPMWIETTLPDENTTPWQRLVMGQDTGGAIRGNVRADVYFGSGERAETLAGRMKQSGRLWILEPVMAQ